MSQTTAQPAVDVAQAATRFAPAELEGVLKHYDLGRIDSIRELTRGSSLAPKVVVAGPWGKFLVKRRAPGEDHPHQVAFCHGLILHLLDRGVPAPALIGTRYDNNSMLQLDGRVYEVAQFIDGDPFDRTAPTAAAAGTTLAHFHAGAASFQSPYHSPSDFAHGDERAEILIDRCLDRLTPATEPTVGVRPTRPAPGPLLDNLRTLWRRAVAALDHAGVAAWPRQLLHADWHPGNLVFAPPEPATPGQTIRAVLDYDSCRRGPRLFDLAAGALNFSILSTEGLSSEGPSTQVLSAAGDTAPPPGTPPAPVDPTRWPAHPDEPRARAFLAEYQAQQPALSGPERAALAPAMAGAMILESLGPVASTGAFAGIPGLEFLDMVRRKAGWLLEHADRVASLASP